MPPTRIGLISNPQLGDDARRGEGGFERREKLAQVAAVDGRPEGQPRGDERAREHRGERAHIGHDRGPDGRIDDGERDRGRVEQGVLAESSSATGRYWRSRSSDASAGDMTECHRHGEQQHLQRPDELIAHQPADHDRGDDDSDCGEHHAVEQHHRERRPVHTVVRGLAAANDERVDTEPADDNEERHDREAARVVAVLVRPDQARDDDYAGERDPERENLAHGQVGASPEDVVARAMAAG